MMRKFLPVIVLVALFSAGCSTTPVYRSDGRLAPAVAVAPVAQTVSAPAFTERMDSIPDLAQFDPNAAFPYGGVHYCGPCAVSNSLAWLAGQGYPDLMSDKNEPAVCQVDLANTLASRRYLDTTLEMGTTPADLLKGVSKYIKDHGYQYRRLEFKGWRKHPAEFSTGSDVPDLDWIKSGLYGHSAVWMNIGWYKYNPDGDRYNRMGGHWVTLVGFGVDEKGFPDPNVLVIHDPGVKNRTSPNQNDFIRAERIRYGTLSEPGEKTVSAAGFNKVFGANLPKGGKAFGILDGVVVLEMQVPETQPGKPENLKQTYGTPRSKRAS